MRALNTLEEELLERLIMITDKVSRSRYKTVRMVGECIMVLVTSLWFVIGLIVTDGDMEVR